MSKSMRPSTDINRQLFVESISLACLSIRIMCCKVLYELLFVVRGVRIVTHRGSENTKPKHVASHQSRHMLLSYQMWLLPLPRGLRCGRPFCPVLFAFSLRPS